MVSHKHKCIFIHIPKVAGVSIEQVFLDDLGLDYNNRSALLLGINTNKTIGPPRLSHLTAKEYVSNHYLSEELFNEYFKFSFVRNPYNRVFSFYKYFGYDMLISFETFVIDYLPKLINEVKTAYFFQPQYYYLYNENKLKVDFVGKLEHISFDFKEISRELNLSHIQLSHSNNSKEKNLKTKIIRFCKIIIKHPEIITHFSYNKNQKSKNISNNMKKTIQKYYLCDFKHFDYEL